MSLFPGYYGCTVMLIGSSTDSTAETPSAPYLSTFQSSFHDSNKDESTPELDLYSDFEVG